MQPIPYGRQFISDEDINAVITTLKSDFLTQGPKIEEFEKKFADYIGCEYALAVANGTAALHLAAIALDVDKTTKVITTPITFAASANCIRYCGGEVEFADIDPATLLIDINAIEKKLQSQPEGTYQGIVAVDFAGMAVNLEKLRKLADQYNLWIIEDACHSPGGYFIDTSGNKQLCGNGQFADLAVFSFHPVKHIACGEGGMITTNNKELYEKIKLLRTHGITKEASVLYKNDGGWYYEMQELGYNYRLTDFQAALGTSQLARADEGLAKRQQIASKYNEAFQNLPLKTFPPKQHDLHAYHLYVIHTERRKELYDFLRSEHIYTQVHYIPVHLQPYYKSLGFKEGTYAHAENYYNGCLSLPMYPTLKPAEQHYVIEKILNFYNYGK